MSDRFNYLFWLFISPINVQSSQYLLCLLSLDFKSHTVIETLYSLYLLIWYPTSALTAHLARTLVLVDFPIAGEFGSRLLLGLVVGRAQFICLLHLRTHLSGRLA